PEERRAVQRAGDDYRVLPSPAHASQRRRLAERRDRGRGSALPRTAVLHEHELPPRSRRGEVRAVAVQDRTAVTGQDCQIGPPWGPPSGGPIPKWPITPAVPASASRSTPSSRCASPTRSWWRVSASSTAARKTRVARSP